jgi:hypothetical protein
MLSRTVQAGTGVSDGMALVVIVLSTIAVVVTVCAFVMARHPEKVDDDSSTEGGGRDFFGDVTDRPAGPGAESDGVARPGEPAPGPSADSLPVQTED